MLEKYDQYQNQELKFILCKRNFTKAILLMQTFLFRIIDDLILLF